MKDEPWGEVEIEWVEEIGGILVILARGRDNEERPIEPIDEVAGSELLLPAT